MASCARRTVQLEEDDLPYRKGSNATIRSEGTGTQYYAKQGIVPMYDSNETLRSSRPVSTASSSSMRVRRISSLVDGNTRFPKLEDCAHFHYDFVELKDLKALLLDDENELYHHNGEDVGDHVYFIQVSSGDRSWTVRRTIQNFRMLDQKLHRCIYDRKFSHLTEIGALELDEISPQELRDILRDYLLRFSSLAGSMLNCGSVLNWLEIDNRGNHLVAVDDSGINTPAIGAAHAVKRYTAQAADEISLEVGDIISVIDMPPSDDTIWWRGKRGFEVGFFPFECVELIGEKLPSFVSGIPETPRNRQLLKKHGKFLNFLRTFFNNRPERNQLKQSGIVKERVFGCDLGEHLLNSGHDVPLVLKSCTDVIETHGLVDGIYRLSGITSNIQKLRLAFDEDRVPDLTSEIYLQDVHSISSLLKMYFRELPNPLLTYQLYDKFAEAVRDEDNKLLKIHDVVQQLPPPHYRTTEYLMRHLARVAAQGHETGMHSKNLAIVWAPNLLRSKELETGGGAAALQGVGIQAVVTEFLILYAELIFSDKMPSYSSPELKKTQRKPRPKSLAISTPTRLLTLEEARERALNMNNSSIINPTQKYIDVGGGPQNLPAKYHTVIDLPGYKKKGQKDSGGGKMKKSPGGFRSLFSRTRSGSIRQKGRKPSIQESLNFESGERKAITEEDVQHWKRRRIRSAKSAESLLSLPITSRLGSPLTESLDPNKLMNMLSGSDSSSPTKYPRSLSIDSPLQLNTSPGEKYPMYPSFFLDDGGGREMPVDVNPDDIELDFNDDDSPGKENMEGSENRPRRKQSFVRNEQKRRVICHRRTPSAPTTPKRDIRDLGSSCHDTDEMLKQQLSDYDKSVSQPVLQGALSAKPPRNDRAKTSQKKLFESDGSMADSPKLKHSSADEIVSEKRKGSKTPPKDRKKLKDEKCSLDFRDSSEFHNVQRDETKDGSDQEHVSEVHKDSLIKELPESPGSKRKNWNRSASAPEDDHSVSKGIHHFYSRVHDYAEIDDKDLDPTITESHNPRIHLKSDSKIEQYSEKSKTSPKQDAQTRRYKVESIENLKDLSGNESQNLESKIRTASASDTSGEPKLLETNFFIDNEQPVVVHSVPLDDCSRKSSTSDSANNSASSSQRYLPHEDLLSEISNFEKGLETIQKYPYKKSMAKCMSIPSDIQKSLENISNGSDILSSVTISELSQSQDNVFISEMDTLTRRRRSTSLDGLSDESPMSRTLLEINAQIDRAFKQDRHKAQSLHNLQGKSENFTEDNTSDITSQLISYDNELLESPPRQRSFGSVRESDIKSPVERTCSAPDRHNGDKKQTNLLSRNHSEVLVNQNKFVDRPAAEIHIVETPQVIRAPLRPNKSDEKPSISTTPTRPVPPGSLDIVSPELPLQSRIHASQSDTHIAQHASHTQSKVTSPTLPPRSGEINKITSQAKTGFRMSEEDFQKALLSEDPDSVRHFQQSMMYSPVRSHRRGVLDGERSNRSSLASPDGQKSILNKSGIVSPDTSPRQTHSKISQSPDSSPRTYSKPPHSKVAASPDASPGSYARHPHSRVAPSPEATPGSPTTRQSHSKISHSPDVSPRQQHSKISSSPKSDSRHQQSKLPVPQSPKSVPQSPKSESSHHHSKVPQSPRSESRTYRSPPSDKRNYYQSQAADKKTNNSPVIEKKGPSPKIEKKNQQNRSTVQSPMSPEHMQPRWEDLAGLNESFSDIDLAMFNEDWKNQLAPTGDSIRQSSITPQLSDKWSSQNEVFQEAEVSTDTDTVVMERPSIKRKNNQESVNAADSKTNLNEIEFYDNVPEHESLMPEIIPGLSQPETRTELRQMSSAERPMIQRSNTVPQPVPAQPPVNRFGFSSRAVLERANTVPGPSAVPLSPTSRNSLASVVEQSSSFESVSGLTKQVSFDTGIGVNSAFTSVEKSAVKKSNTTPSLTRQTSFDSSSYSSVRVTSLGSSFEELDSSTQNHMIHSGQSAHVTIQQGLGSVSSHSVIQTNQPIGTFITMSASDRNPITVSSAGNIEPAGFSVLIRSDSGQSSDAAFPELPNAGRAFRNFNMSSNFSDNLPRMLEEIDPNESCLGLATHQNMSNEMKEMMQEQMKEHSGVMSPLDDIINPLSNITSPFSLQPRTFYDTNHPLEGHDMESSIEIPNDVQSVHLPSEDIQVLSEGPVLIATPGVLMQHSSNSLPRHQHVPIDNTEEEYQNAVNADLERNLASLTEYLPHHVSVCEPQNHFRDSSETENRTDLMTTSDFGGSVSTFGVHASGLEHLTMISPLAFTIKDTPEPVTRDSDSTSSSSLSSSMVSSTSSIIQTPSAQSDWNFRQSVFRPVFLENLNTKGDLAAPPLEMIEICKSVITKPKTRQINMVNSEPENKVKSPVRKSFTLTFDFPSSRRDKKTITSSKESQNNMSAERGETKLVIDRRPSLKKKTGKPKHEAVSKTREQHLELVDSDHGEQSGTEDDVFIDPSEVTPNTTFYGARSKYFQRRDFLSQGSFPLDLSGVQSVQRSEINPNEVQKHWDDPQSRFSVDESMLQMASSRHEDLFSKHMGFNPEYQGDLAGMDIGHESSEDIRFSKAHRSSKLMSLCEMFEKGSATSLNNEDEDDVKEKTITPPGKNIVSSIKQMHESIEMEMEESDVFSKPKRVKKVSLNESGSSNDSFNASKDDSFESKDKQKQCLSPTYTSVKEGNFLFEAPGSSEPYKVGRPYSKGSDVTKENAGQGKPPKYRSNSKTRTPSESSLSENEGIKQTQKLSQTDSSPKSGRYGGSPKGSRYSQISSEDDGSPRTSRLVGSSKLQDKKTDSSPKQVRQKEGPPVAPRQSPKMSKAMDSGSKIPVRNGSQKGPNGSPKGPKYGEKSDQHTFRYSSSPKSSHNGKSSTKTDTSPKIRQRQDSSERGEKEVQKRSITKRGESIEERYHLNFEPESMTKEKEKVNSGSDEGGKKKGEEKKRRGSIKELMNLFEEKTGGKVAEGSPGDSPDKSPPQIKLRTRVRSVSPSAAFPRSPPTMPVNVRHSVELPVRGTLSHSEGVFKISEGVYRPQHVRLGPKPFYGAK